MAAWVTLRNGKVLKYNTANNYNFVCNNTVVDITDGKYLIASIPIDMVERVDWTRPCRIYREQRKDKLPILQ